MKTEPNTKRKLISKRLVDISSLVAELRAKCGRYALTHEAKASLNPYINMNEYDEMNVKCKLHTWNEGWDACCDELEKMLKEERK